MVYLSLTQISLLILISRNNTLPTEAANNSVEDNNNMDSEFIDLTGLEQQAYGEPNKESCDALAEWSESSLVNPEETGNYFKGDNIPMPVPLLRNGLAADRRWPNGIIPYLIKGSFNKKQLAILKDVIAIYHNLTCVRFVPRKEQDDYVVILNSSTGCHSTIGKLGGVQGINFQSACFYTKGTIIHEFMHVIGFLHEVSRKDRNEYVTIINENIKPSLVAEFKIYESDDLGVPYDYGSVMHYSEYAHSKNGKKTIVAKKDTKGVKLGQRKMLSSGDIEKINRMYNCKKKH